MTATSSDAAARPQGGGASVVPEALRLAEGVALRGISSGSGLRDAPGLVVRSDGQMLQVTPVLYRLLEAVSEQPGAPREQLAAGLGRRLGRAVPPHVLDELVRRLVPLGVLAGTEAALSHTANPLLALRHKVVVSDPKMTARLASTLTFLFHPVVVVVGLCGFLVAVWVALVVEGLAQASRQTIESPGVLLVLFAFTVVSAGLHELGHAAACRARGGKPGTMGAGLYLAWPAFYTDVNDSYRLDRRSRLLVDLGGLWVNAVLAAGLVAAWLLTSWSPLLLGVVIQVVLMLRQLAPVIRADGYHILADLTGVPDLFAHIKPTLLGLLPWRWRTASPLRRRARLAVTAWVLLVVPLLALGALGALLSLPRLATSTLTAVTARATGLGSDARQAHWLAMSAHALAIGLLILPVVAMTLMVAQVGRRFVRWIVRTGSESRPKAVRNGLVAAFVLASLAWVWWPVGQWTPIRTDERGTLVSEVRQLPTLLGRPGGEPNPDMLSSRYQPALALVPRGGGATLLLSRTSTGRSLATYVGGPAGAHVPARTFPFQLPSALSGPNTQQTVALGLRDGGVVYDVAVAMVRVDGTAPAMPRNEAWALAACARCTTVAVSFQVVFVLGQGTAVMPVNAAVAANGNCLACATAALAVQLVASVPAHIDPAVEGNIQSALAGLSGLGNYGSDVSGVLAQVSAVRNQVVSILTSAGIPVQQTGVTPTEDPRATASADPSSSNPAAATTPSSDPTETPAPTDSGAAAPSDAPGATGTPGPTDTPGAQPSPS